MNNTQSALLDAMNTLSKMPKIDIKGKQYASVASRVEETVKELTLSK